tara:strand:+ start:569 stop:787 length:219 start_codon:yes stop_codon:yes gene_type:complete
VNRYVVVRKCIANEFVFVDAENEKQAIVLAEKGDCDSASITLEFVEHRPSNTWKVELIESKAETEMSEYHAE